MARGHQYRIRTLDLACPRCGANLVIREKGLASHQSDGPLRWIPYSTRYCPRGCMLLAADFEDHE